MRASGTFEVTLTPQQPEEGVGHPAIGRMAIEKTFEGDLQGSSSGQMLAAGTDRPDSAGYVAIELVTGALLGRSGTFVLQHLGAMAQGEPRLTVSVVPDSGAGELSGLTGSMTIDIVDGKHVYGFEYSLGGLD